MSILFVFCFFFFFNDTATTEIYTLSLHDALPISGRKRSRTCSCVWWAPREPLKGWTGCEVAAGCTEPRAMIEAILRAQWLSMRSFRLDSRRRAAIFSLITAAVWYGFWTVLALMAEEFASSISTSDALRRGLPAGLFFVFLYWQFAPIVSASLGASLDLKKLLAYPVPHRSLFFIAVLLRITTCAEMLLILAGSLVGLFRNPLYGGFRATPRLLAPYAVFVLFNLLLSAGLRSLLE